MALLLQIETATPTCSVALSENGKLLALEEKTESNIHASVITLFINAVMEKAGKNLAELDAVCVSKGPGSYTGLRIGVSAAKGLCYALEKPLIAVNTLEAMAAGLLRQENIPAASLLCPMLDARRMEVYMALYTMTLEEAESTRAQIIDEHFFDPWLKEHNMVFFGTGAAKCGNLYANRPNALFIPDFYQSAAHLTALATQKFSQSQFEDTAYFEPYYLKDFVSSRKKEP